MEIMASFLLFWLINLLLIYSNPGCNNGCQSYKDGCNDCICLNVNGLPLCEVVNPNCNSDSETFCQKCFRGYQLNANQTESFGCNPVGCGINNCTSWFDGCNTCNCDENGNEICTQDICDVIELPPPRCVGCPDGYELSEDQNGLFGCVEEKTVGCVNGCTRYFDGCNSYINIYYIVYIIYFVFIYLASMLIKVETCLYRCTYYILITYN